MATLTANGINYEVDRNSVRFFESRGMILENGDWALNLFGGKLFNAQDPDSMMSSIRDCVDGDIENGNEAKIAMLILGPLQAVVFYLEGGIKRDDLERASEGIDFIAIPDVEIDGRKVTVRIQNNSEYRVATADSNGDVLP